MQSDIWRREYTEMLQREKNAEEYLNNPIRTPEEIDQWTPEYSKLLSQLENLLMSIGHYKPENILNGWGNL